MGARHVLVVASQCADMRPLPELAAAATALHDVLCDAELGGCAPGLPDGRGLLLVGPRQTNADIYTSVRAAIAHADACQATLVLALLGHGFVPGDSSTLYFMGPNSVEDVRDSAVNVPELLLEAADRSRIAGVIGIIDTCHAGGAQPNLRELAGGARRGRTSFSVLMASAVGQEARDLRLSRELAGLLRAGADTGEPMLLASNLEMAIRARLIGQDLAVLSYSGARGAGLDGLWLAANRRFTADHGQGSIGRLGTVQLLQAMSAAGRETPANHRWDGIALRELRAEVGSDEWNPAAIRLNRLLDDLQVSLHTSALLRSWLSSVLTTTVLRNAAAALRPGPGGRLIRIPPEVFARAETVVEYLALNYPGSLDSCRSWICRFVVALAVETNRDLDAPELAGWAARIDAIVPFNDAVRGAARRKEARRLRLVVSLHASVAGDWPATVDAWLMDGAELIDHEVFDNRSEPDRPGAEAALAEAVDWAEAGAEELDPGLRLQRIEVAAPTALLLQWRPEEVFKGPRLGVDYDVVVRWSQRLNPPSGLKWINGHAVTRWERMAEAAGSAPVDWLPRPSTVNAEALHESLRADHYAQAIGLDHSPGLDGAELLDLLLAFSPVVLWPIAQDGFPTDCQDAFCGYWHTLPTGFIDAYRSTWRNDPADGSVHVVARLRAVWDDLEWLYFCKSLRRRSPRARQGGSQ